MTPELRAFVLSLPLDVRRELCKAKCDAAYGLKSTQGAWDVLRMSPDIVPLYMCAIEAPHPPACAVLPVSPIAIALHAAKMTGGNDATVAVGSGDEPNGAIAAIGFTVKPPLRGCRAPVQASVDNDPTGHRAAISLLQKVMAKVTP